MGVAILDAMTLGDIPARPATGEAPRTSSREATIEYHVNGPESGTAVVLFASFARSAAERREAIAYAFFARGNDLDPDWMRG